MMPKNKLDYGNGYHENNSIAIIWEVEDVRRVLEDYEHLNFLIPKLDDDDCMEILEHVHDKHDATLGVTWENIYYSIEYHYEKEIQEEKEKIRESETS